MRNQVMALTRLYKPEILFFPDWYAHYVDDHDLYRTGRMAEESPYGGSSYFLQEYTYLGYPGFAARQYYFFNATRPYRDREGGEGNATMTQVDIGAVIERKIAALLELKTANEWHAAEARRRSGRDFATSAFVRAYVTELAEANGARHRIRHAEEFNHLRPVAGLPAHVRERAVPIKK
jgi:hypothetical protein